MLDMRPRGKGSMVVRVRFREPKELCAECLGLMLDTCRKEGINEPDPNDGEFHVPFYFLNFPCSHTGSPHMGRYLVRSVFEGSEFKKENPE